MSAMKVHHAPLHESVQVGRQLNWSLKSLAGWQERRRESCEGYTGQ